MKLDMMMEAIEGLARERGVEVDTILDAFANALVAAYKRSPGAAEEARVTIDPDSGEVIVYAQELDEDGNVVRSSSSRVWRINSPTPSFFFALSNVSTASATVHTPGDKLKLVKKFIWQG